MLNLLIIDDNINDSIYLLNYISKNSHQIRVHSLTMSLNEGIKIMNTGIIDIVLIHMNVNIDTINISLNNISNSYAEKYKKSIIVITERPYTFNNKSSSYIYECIPDTETISIVFSKIKEIAQIKLVNFNRDILLNKINKELDFLGYKLSYSGTKYLAECIALIYNNYDTSENLKQNVYPIIAKQHKKTINNIKCNILTATNSMFYECDEKRLKEYFNFYTIVKPTPKLVIYTVLNKLYLL